MSDRYNLVTIGAGAAGLVSAYIAAAVRAKVALVERGKMGGDCLNYGCVPSKALIRSARFVADMKRARELGVRTANYELVFADVMARVHRIIKRIEPHDSIERYSELGVECIKGQAEIIDPHTIRIGGRTLHTRKLILALGASPSVPPLKGLERTPYLTSENLWEIRELPRRLIVLGGGPIGCEMAQAFARFGSEVTQIEMGPRIMPREDEETAALMQDTFKREGIKLLLGTKAKEINLEGSKKFLVCESNGGDQRVEFDSLLVAVGRRANTQGVDWSKWGVALNPNGTIKVDPYMRAAPDIYACGDVVGPYQFTHVAAHQAWYCAVNALFSPFKKFRADYRVIPWVTFTDPEVAHVGLNEIDARQQGISYEVTHYGIDDLDRAIAESADHGFVKVLTAPKGDQILGATIVGHNAGELISEFVLAMKHGLGLRKILATIHSYPTFAEANKYAAGNWQRAHTPPWALKMLGKFHAWRR